MLRGDSRERIPRATLKARSDLPSPVLGRNGKWWTSEPYEYLWETSEGDHHLIAVPAGFRFDLASIPRIFWRLVAPFDLSLAAPLIHDFLYRHAGKLPGNAVIPWKAFSREESDAIFLRVMEQERVSKWRRVIAYKAVRACGWRVWKKSRERRLKRES